MPERPPHPTTIPIVFDPDILTTLREIAANDRRSVGEVVRRAVSVWLASEDAKVVIASGHRLKKIALDSRMAE